MHSNCLKKSPKYKYIWTKTPPPSFCVFSLCKLFLSSFHCITEYFSANIFISTHSLGILVLWYCVTTKGFLCADDFLTRWKRYQSGVQSKGKRELWLDGTVISNQKWRTLRTLGPSDFGFGKWLFGSRVAVGNLTGGKGQKSRRPMNRQRE